MNHKFDGLFAVRWRGDVYPVDELARLGDEAIAQGRVGSGIGQHRLKLAGEPGEHGRCLWMQLDDALGIVEATHFIRQCDLLGLERVQPLGHCRACRAFDHVVDDALDLARDFAEASRERLALLPSFGCDLRLMDAIGFDEVRDDLGRCQV